MSDQDAVIATLISYYDAIGAHEFDAIPNYFTNSVTIVTLAGSQSVTGAPQLAGLYRNLWETWSAKGISTEMGYSGEEFVVLPVQSNCKLAKTQLTNYDFDGNQLQTWNCTYVMVKEDGDWLINLATSDNRASADWQKI
jgi:ketosteroid isomerase-like protein